MTQFKVKKQTILYSLLILCLTGLLYSLVKFISPSRIDFPSSFAEVQSSNGSFVFKSLQKAGFVIKDISNNDFYSCQVVSTTMKPCSLEVGVDLNNVSIYWFNKNGFFNKRLIYAIKKDDVWLLTPEQAKIHYTKDAQNRWPITMLAIFFLFLSVYIFSIIQEESENE